MAGVPCEKDGAVRMSGTLCSQRIKARWPDGVDVAVNAIVREPNRRLVAIVPRMLTYFGTAPERYEIDEYDVLWWEER